MQRGKEENRTIYVHLSQCAISGVAKDFPKWRVSLLWGLFYLV
jgi:hypothetical protein